MQFHLEGYRFGDPADSRPLEDQAPAPKPFPLPETVDVLVVGSGPTGLTLAAQLAAFPDITTLVVEQKDGPLRLGQADGIACRSVEMFEAFGFAERVLKEAYWVNETVFWKPDAAQRAAIVRSGRIQDTEDGLSEFPHLILNQARVHDFFLDVMRRSPSRAQPAYSRRLLDLVVDEAAAGDLAAHAVTARLERTDPGHEGEVETVRARFVVGCDGARSLVRRALDLPLRGDSANQAWGVMDVLAVTDFPDIRLKAAIHSANEGNILIIPREGGYLVRLYIELDKLSAEERVASRNITAEHLVAAAQRILQPYTLEVKEIAWWSVYEIGQRLCDRFDDATDQRGPRIFIAGDACHTHSPKAGQGMNMSMADTFNLGWKLASVLRGQARPGLLRTYSDERQAVAQSLIDFDREFAEMFSAPPKDPNDPDSKGVDPEEFQRYFVKQGRFTAGVAIQYEPSTIVAPPTHQALAHGFVMGMRFHSAPVIRLADAKPVELGHTVKADGRWRLFAFAGREDPTDRASTFWRLCDFLKDAAQSPLVRYTPSGADPDAVIDVRGVFQQPHRSLGVEAAHPLMLPRKGCYGLVDYEKMFCPDLRNGDIFDLRGVDRDGAMVIVRPDQYVAAVLPLHAVEELGAFFDGIFPAPR